MNKLTVESFKTYVKNNPEYLKTGVINGYKVNSEDLIENYFCNSQKYGDYSYEMLANDFIDLQFRRKLVRTPFNNHRRVDKVEFYDDEKKLVHDLNLVYDDEHIIYSNFGYGEYEEELLKDFLYIELNVPIENSDFSGVVLDLNVANKDNLDDKYILIHSEYEGYRKLPLKEYLVKMHQALFLDNYIAKVEKASLSELERLVFTINQNI